MAIYSLHMGFISRSEGRSSVGFSAYIGGGKSYDQRTGVRFDYSNKSEVILRRILAPEGSPDWAQNAILLWNKVEQFEDHIAALRFRGDRSNPLKNQKSLEAKEQFLSSTQTAQIIMGAIPLEFSKEEAEACVEAFLTQRFVARGLVVEYALHWDKGNPHFHGLITRRALIEGEFSQRKDREIVSKAEHTLTRKAWEVTANKYLELGGHEVRIDCRSHAERGSLFLATEHEGWHARHLAEQGHYSRIVSDNAAIREQNIQILYDHPEALIHELTLKRTIFTRKHVEEEIIRRVGGDEKLFALLKARVEALDISVEFLLKQANDNYSIDDGFAADLQNLAGKLATRLLTDQTLTYRVGESINRDELFTTVAVKKQEDEITAFAETLHQRQTKEVAKSGIVTALHNREAELGFLLSEEQKHAIDYLCSGSDIRILNGKAGTGKTTLLKAVAEAYQRAGYRVLGTSFQGKAVEIMQQEIGIPCKTLDSFIHAWTQHDHYQSRIEKGELWGKAYFYALDRIKELTQHQFTAKDVIMVDEANMMGGRLWNALLKQATSQGAKILIIQDSAQIKSREAGDFGRLFAQRYGYAETRDIIRQRVDWQRSCAKLLNDHHVVDGLQPYYQKGHLHWYETPEKLREALTEAYVADFNADPQTTRMVLGYRNTEVYALNQSIRQALKDQGILREHFKFQGQEYSVGDQIRFMQNDHQGRWVGNVASSSSVQGVKNGSLGIIEAYDAQTAKMTVQLQDKRRVQFKIQDYPHITLGYAMSIHKSEGSTFDKTYVAFDPLMDPATVLVAMTRHRQDVQAYINRQHFVDFKHLIDQVSKGSFRENLCDYQVGDAQKPYFERVQQYKDLMVEAVTLREEMEGSLKPSEPLYKHSLYLAYQQCFAEKQRVARTLLQNWNDHKPYIRLAGIRKDVVEVEAGLRPRLLSEIEHRASLQAQGYLELTQKARTLWNTMTATHPGFLAMSHPLYSDYQTLKADRNVLAGLMQENPKLYSPFLRVEKDPETGELKNYWGDPVKHRVYLASLKEQANDHRQAQNAETYYKQLSAEQKQNYDVVNAYISARNQAAALYKHIQQEKNTSVQLSLSESYLNGDKFKALQAKRDTLALQIIEAPEKYAPFFARFTLKEDKLLDHAVAGELREKVTAYAKETTLSTRALQAQELKRILNHASDYRLLKENGLDANRLTFDSAFYEQVKVDKIPADTQPEEIYKAIQHYLASSRTVAQHWKIVQHNKAERQNWVPLLQARNGNASQLVQNPAALAVISSMRPGIASRLYQQAERGHKPDALSPKQSLESKEQTSFQKIKHSSISAEQVLASASTRYYDLATSLLGPPHQPMSSRSALRFGKKGSTVFNIAGPKAGLWHDFTTGEGGNLFQLVQREKDLTFKQSVEHLASYLSLRPETTVYEYKEVIKAQTLKDEAKETAVKLNAVAEIHLKSQSIAGTLAEKYLSQERSIQGPLPDTLRYLPKGAQFMYKGERKILAYDCLAAFGYNPVGRLSSVQLTKLDYKGCRAKTREEEKLNKIQYGLSKGSYVVVQEGNNTSRAFIAEGLETALSIKEAGVQGKIIASLGIHNIPNYQGLEKEIILCADNDTHKPSSQTAKLIENVKAQFTDQGKSVIAIQPARAGDDFNDVLKCEGLAGIKAYVRGYSAPADKQAGTLPIAKATTLNHPIALSPASKIEAHLTEHLKIYKGYAGTSIAKEAQQELTAYLNLLQKDQSLMQDLKAQNATLVKEVEQIMNVSKGQEKER